MPLIVGLGASGASVARYLRRAGVPFAATDSRAQPPGAGAVGDAPSAFGRFASPVPLDEVTEAVISPGVPLSDPFVQELQAAGIAIVGDIELFARAARAPVIGITGSNGKSTVTTLVGEMAKAAGLRVAVGGNLGTPALDLLADDVQLYVLELSSFQLETTHSLRCQAATILNLSPDHLDRHGTMQAYAQAKARIFRGCAGAVVNRDDAEVMGLLEDGTRDPLEAGTRDPGPATAGTRDSGLGTRDAKVVSFGLGAPDTTGDYGIGQHAGADWLFFPSPESRVPSPGFKTADLRIFGSHNWANALAALALADASGIPRAASLEALREFRGLPHRCEFVGEIDGIAYFNDSKGTNVGSTLAALNGLPAPIVWIAGGQGKGQSFAGLREPLARKGRAAVLFGADAAAIERDVFGALPLYREPDMATALQRARSVATRGDRVLLSPACASFDQFRNYVERGEQFCALVKALA